MKKIFILFFAISFKLFGQIDYYPKHTDSLAQNSNIIIDQSKEVLIESIESYSVKTTRKIWVLNELGLSQVEAYELYGKNVFIKQIQATIYDAFGQEIKKIKRKDFVDESVTGNALITDNRVLSLNFVPKSYPFYIVYESEVQSKNTAFLPTWFPLEGYNCSILKSSLTLKWNSSVNLKYKIYNQEVISIDEEKKENQIIFSVANSKAYTYEPLSIPFRDWSPKVMIGLNEFYLEGVKGTAESWEKFGNWMSNELMNNTTELSETTIQKVTELVQHEKNIIAKAKKIYQFIQDNTRYVSIQLGIGGWKPMNAKDVDRLGYGDCKALTNYTRALLKAVNIPSYYTIVYGGDKRNLEEDFVSMQGNHIILGIPNNNDILWLECTSQSMPFGFQGDFTDDRIVLIVDDTYSKLTRTKKFFKEDNTIQHNAHLYIGENGNVKGTIKVISNNLQYNKRVFLEKLDLTELIKTYKEEYATLPNLNIEKHSFINNKDKVEFTEIIDFQSKDLFRFNSSQVLIPINLINQFFYVPPRVRNRKLPFEIESAFIATDEIQITLEKNLKLIDFPEKQSISSQFGEYNMSVDKREDGTLLYKRVFKLNEGIYPSSDYDSYRKFREQVARLENSKIILNK